MNYRRLSYQQNQLILFLSLFFSTFVFASNTIRIKAKYGIPTVYKTSIQELNSYMKLYAGLIDKVEFKRDSHFKGKGVRIYQSGITFEAYGSGETPIIDGENWNYGWVFVSRKDENGNDIPGSTTENMQNEYGFKDDDDNMDTQHNSITIRDIEIHGYFMAGIRGFGNKNWKIINVESHHNGVPEGIWGRGEFPIPGEGIELSGQGHKVQKCIIHDNGAHGIVVN